MDQFDTKHYRFSRTSKDAFGSFAKMRKINFCENDPHNGHDTHWILIIVMLIVLASIVM